MKNMNELFISVDDIAGIVKIIKENLVTYIGEDGLPLNIKGGEEFNSTTHTKVLNENVFNGQNFSGNFVQEAGMIFNFTELAVKNKFIVICNLGRNNGDEIESAFIHFSEELTPIQEVVLRCIINYLSEKGANFNKFYFAMYNSNKNCKECSLNDLFKNNGDKPVVKCKKA